MKLHSKRFRVRPGGRVDLRAWPTRTKPHYQSKEHYHRLLGEHAALLSAQQHVLYAANQYAVLLIFQAMDAGGKDGVITHVMSGVGPQGCQVFPFKQPSLVEWQHDFLWRSTRDLPERGQIAIFNRSYYEEVLIVRVHPELLRHEGLGHRGRDPEFWRDRYRSIRAFERHLHDNRTRVVKIYLHISNEEQRKRLLARIEEPSKNWKISLADVEERKCWTAYTSAYEACLGATSTHHSPWYVVPADDKDNARLIVSRIVLDSLQALRLRYPTPTAARRRELRAIRARLAT